MFVKYLIVFIDVSGSICNVCMYSNVKHNVRIDLIEQKKSFRPISQRVHHRGNYKQTYPPVLKFQSRHNLVHKIDSNILKFFRELVGGMKCVRRNSKHYSDVNAPHGLTVGVQGNTTMQCAPWQKLATSGISPTPNGVDSDPKIKTAESLMYLS